MPPFTRRFIQPAVPFAVAFSVASLGVAPAASALLSLSATPVTLAGLAPGASSTGAGTLIATTAPQAAWTLSVKDQGSGQGAMTAAGVGCTGADQKLANALSVTASGGGPGVSSSGSVTISSVDQTVLSAASAPLTAATLTATYSQVVPATETMRTGCVYSETVTFTLQ